MLALVNDILTNEQVKDYYKNLERGSFFGEEAFKNPRIKPIIETVKKYAPVKTGEKSYWILEHKPLGHDWHYDGCKENGAPSSMPWCRYSAVTLLSHPDSFDGGEFVCQLEGQQTQSFKKELYKNLLIYTSGAQIDPLFHMATPHKNGERWVLLMFLEGFESYKG
jgi:hypothetical protein